MSVANTWHDMICMIKKSDFCILTRVTPSLQPGRSLVLGGQSLSHDARRGGAGSEAVCILVFCFDVKQHPSIVDRLSRRLRAADNSQSTTDAFFSGAPQSCSCTITAAALSRTERGVVRLCPAAQIEAATGA